MTTTINADDGVISGSAGLKSTPDSSGELALQTNGVTKVTVTAAGNVGIGTSSLAPWQGTGLQISDRSALFQLTINDATYLANNLAYDGTNWRYIVTGAGLVYSVGASGIASVFRAASGTAGAIATLVESTRADASGNFYFDSGYGSVATAYGCRAWVNFNGTGTVAIRASGNVSSITDNGTGNYTVNFTTAMPDANYAFVGTISNTGSASYNTAAISANGTLTRTTSAYGFTCTGITGTTNAAFDPNFVNVSIFR